MGFQSEKAAVHLVMRYSTVSKLLATLRFKTHNFVYNGDCHQRSLRNGREKSAVTMRSRTPRDVETESSSHSCFHLELLTLNGRRAPVPRYNTASRPQLVFPWRNCIVAMQRPNTGGPSSCVRRRPAEGREQSET
jgi:hypothetical protein